LVWGCSIAQAFDKKLKKLNTDVVYRQQKYNLLREEVTSLPQSLPGRVDGQRLASHDRVLAVVWGGVSIDGRVRQEARVP
jgi:hypothetical protein